MALFTPHSHTFNHTLSTPSPTDSLLVVCSDLDATSLYDFRTPEVKNVPNWLTVSDITKGLDGSYYISFELALNTTVADAMAIGTYTASLEVTWYNRTTRKSSAPSYFQATLIIEEGNKFELTPSNLNFSYVTGAPNPPNQIAQVKTNYNWNITSTQTWLTVAPAAGLGDSTIVVSVDPSGLPSGTYTGRLVGRDPYYERYTDVTLIVNNPDSEVDFLNVTPTNLEFVAEVDTDYEGATKTLTIESSGTWTVSSKPSWLTVSASSGTSGSSTIDVDVVTTDLPIGTLTASIVFTMGTLSKTVVVQLIIINYVSTGIDSENFYFAKDRNKLIVSSTIPNTYLQLLNNVATGTNNLTYPQQAPYFKGIANIIIGQETEVLQNPVTPTTNFTTRVYNGITPVNYGIYSSNVNKITNAVSAIKDYQNVRFLRGYTPTTANKLCYIPSTITVTKTSILTLTTFATTAPNDIIITGDVTATISNSLLDNLYVYTAIINLADFSLTTGNTINIAFGTLSVDVTIKASEPEETLLAFENQWGALEYFNASGFLTKSPSVTAKTSEFANNGKKHTKIISIDSGVEYSLNSGWIYSQDEAEWFTKVLDSKRLFVLENNQFTEIILTTKKLELYATRDYLKAYSLNFKKAIV